MDLLLFTLDQVMTTKEASLRWNISDSNLRNALTKFGKFDDQIKRGLVRKTANNGGWLITEQAMQEVFGDPRKKE